MSKKLVQINVVCNGSTGRIMEQIQKKAEEDGWETYSFFGRGKPSNSKCYKIGNKFSIMYDVFLTRILDKHGHGNKKVTRKLIKKIKEIDPDVIQLHNIHGYYINIQILFNYLKKCNKKIVWTLHDCWAFTGHCAHFTFPKCDKWKEGCQGKCLRKKDYPKCLFKSNAESEYNLKKEFFSNINNVTIVTPSNWLAQLAKDTFFNKYDIKVINNGIDLNVFKPTRTIDVRAKYNIPKEKRIILGVASVWNRSKGLDEFIKLNEVIDTDQYIIVLVGLKNKQIKKLPRNIIGIQRTEKIEELANLYTEATVLYNPSKEETFSLVTAEAVACGTPAIVYNNSAIGELINEKNGYVLNIQDEKKEDKIIEYIKNIKIFKPLEKYSLENMTKEYLTVYKN